MSELIFWITFVSNERGMFSKTAEYGIRAMIFIMLNSLSEKRVSLKEISAEIDSPESFTAKILQSLARAKVVDSIKGPKGGFEINKDKLEEIKLIEIVEVLDGNKVFAGCGLGLKQCDATKPCPLHDHFLEVRESLKKMLMTNKVADLARGLETGLSFLKR